MEGSARRPLVAGAFGGGLVTAVAIGGLALFVGFGSTTTTTVTVDSAPLVVGANGGHAVTPTASQVYARDAPGVVFVSATGVVETPSASEYLKGEGGERGTATGSGFEVDGAGTILTNWHVVAGASSVTVGVGHGRVVPAVIVAKDPSRDVAVLRIAPGALVLHPLSLGDSRGVRVGEPVSVIGNPFGLERTLTTGIISALQRKLTAPNGVTIENVMQTDAPINPGNSGGPLLDADGDVIGINSQIETGGERGGSVGIGFAIPIDAAKGTLAAANHAH